MNMPFIKPETTNKTTQDPNSSRRSSETRGGDCGRGSRRTKPDTELSMQWTELKDTASRVSFAIARYSTFPASLRYCTPYRVTTCR